MCALQITPSACEAHISNYYNNYYYYYNNNNYYYYYYYFAVDLPIVFYNHNCIIS